MTSLNSRISSSDGIDTQGAWNSFGNVTTSHGFDTLTSSHGFAPTNTQTGMIHVSTDVEVSGDQHYQPKKQVE